MRSKVMVAGAIFAVAALCVMANVAYSLAPQGQVAQQSKHAPETCTVQGFVIDSYGNPLPGVEVTMHIMGRTHPGNGLQEIYSMTRTTSDLPNAGRVVFDILDIPKKAEYAYLSANYTRADGTTVSGMTINFSLAAGEVITKGIVIVTKPMEMTTVKGYAVDQYGTPLSGADATLHILQYDPSSETSQELYNFTRQTSDAGQFEFDVITPKLPEPTIPICYAEISVKKGDITYSGRSNNYTMLANDTLNLGIVVRIR